MYCKNRVAEWFGRCKAGGINLSWRAFFFFFFFFFLTFWWMEWPQISSDPMNLNGHGYFFIWSGGDPDVNGCEVEAWVQVELIVGDRVQGWSAISIL
jgi:hypothetical protein